MPPSPNPSYTPTCPFCAISAAYPPTISSSPQPSNNPTNAPSPTPKPTAHILLSHPSLLAFLDHAPISRGHTLVVLRTHREKLGHMSADEGAEVGRWLPAIARAVVGGVADVMRRESAQSSDEGMESDGEKGGAGVGGGGERIGNVINDEGEEGAVGPQRVVLEEEEERELGGEGDAGDYNIVQNNGARAAQVVPHVHFHIIPRNQDVPEVKARSWTVFGKGQREDLDEADAGVLLGAMRRRLGREIAGRGRREGERLVTGVTGGDEGEREQEGWGVWEGKWSRL